MGIWGDFFLRFLGRLLLASPLLAIVVYFKLRGGTGLDLLFNMLCAVPFAFGALYLLAPPVFDLAGELFVAAVYGDRQAKKEPMYGIPQSLRYKGRYEQALDEYEKIIAQYPDEVQPHIAMVEIAVQDLHDLDRAERFFLRGIAALKQDEDRAVLRQMHESSTSRLQPKPEWLVEDQARELHAPKIDRTRPVDEPEGWTQPRYHSGGYHRPDSEKDLKSAFDDKRPKIRYPKTKDKEPPV